MYSCSKKIPKYFKAHTKPKETTLILKWTVLLTAVTSLPTSYRCILQQKMEGQEDECSDSFQFKLPSCSDPEGVVLS